MSGVDVRPSTDVRNLGVQFDATLSLKTHVTQLVGRPLLWLA